MSVDAHRPGLAFLGTWWPVLIGLASLYLATYWDLAHGIWNSEEQAHGPIILVVVLYLIWSKRQVFLPTGPAASDEARPLLGWGLLAVGLLLYALGRSQDILLFEIGSQIPVLLGTLLVVRGAPAVKGLWFALFYLVFMIPLPGLLVDAATGPLKQQISVIAEHILYFFGYPIARSGVTLAIGPYQLLVADACSGLHSMFSLAAMGLLYLYLMAHRSLSRNALLVASILPIAFAANVVRVLVLVLVTYHLGDEVGQGLAHELTGISLFVIALLLLILLDGALGMTPPYRKRA